MSTVRKSKEEARTLGAHLRSRRRERGLSLLQLSASAGVNVGQLSRFERGHFKLLSKNLQTVMEYLQSVEWRSKGQPELVQRFGDLLARSSRHETAARALVLALEVLE